MTSETNISQQTQRDLETILETLDQRIHEMAEDSALAIQHERHLLSSLRDKVASFSPAQ